ncbi:hypothetical protein PAHAL_5G228300 [Panicum hallii]|uniref:Uncharacterized protein n=1 Tax=Panicum hallii TaxID=206008 RepID=A0A2S3HTH1_9POAL|nr:hypothetical protein PAHAL_5G228300 [Panicum hallii]
MERRRSSSTATAARAATGVCRVPGHKIPAEMMTPASTRTAPHHAAPGHWRLISASRPHGDPTSRRPRCSTRHLGINSNLCCQSERDRVPARQGRITFLILLLFVLCKKVCLSIVYGLDEMLGCCSSCDWVLLWSCSWGKRKRLQFLGTEGRQRRRGTPTWRAGGGASAPRRTDS